MWQWMRNCVKPVCDHAFTTLLQVRNDAGKEVGSKVCKIIGGDGGIVPVATPLPSDGLLVDVAYRWDVVCDFTGFQNQVRLQTTFLLTCRMRLPVLFLTPSQMLSCPCTCLLMLQPGWLRSHTFRWRRIRCSGAGRLPAACCPAVFRFFLCQSAGTTCTTSTTRRAPPARHPMSAVSVPCRLSGAAGALFHHVATAVLHAVTSPACMCLPLMSTAWNTRMYRSLRLTAKRCDAVRCNFSCRLTPGDEVQRRRLTQGL